MNALLVLRRRLLPALLLVGIPALLYLPALYYSLDTPFALVDDYNDRQRFSLLDDFGWRHFPGWLQWYILEAGGGSGEGRYRPFWVVYNTVAWNVFGTNPWLHHLARWALHFGAVLLFAAAFWRIAYQGATIKGGNNGAGGPGMPHAMVTLLPVGILAYSWLFFPNVPAARLGPQEVYTVFFLGLCTWMGALLLTGSNSDSDCNAAGWRRRGLPWLQYGLFAVGFLGLMASKETNLALALGLAVSWCVALLIRRQIGWKSILSGAMLVLLLLLFLYQVSEAARESYARFGNELTMQQFLDHAPTILSGLFMVDTSPVISAVFALLTTALLIILAARVIGKQFDNSTLFALFLLGQLVSMFIMLSVSYAVVLRYWYVLIPIFAMLLAFSAQFLLSLLSGRWRRLLPVAAAALVGFIIFFVAVNYYNFMLQTMIQHSTRHTEAQVIGATERLLDSGGYIQVNAAVLGWEHMNALFYYFENLADDADRPARRLRTAPPAAPEQLYYFLNYYLGHYRNDYPVPVHTDLISREDYPILAYARWVSGALQPWNGGGGPYYWRDQAANYPWFYRWIIYRWPVNARDWMDYLLSQGGAAIIQDDWTVHRNGRQLTYIKAPCATADTEAPFLLHIIPADLASIPEGQQRHGFENWDFAFEQSGARNYGICAITARLPDYPVKGIRTGQYRTDGSVIWQAPAAIDTWGSYDARAYLQRLLDRAGAPIIRSEWTVHRSGRRLTYLKEQCATEDTAAVFILHIIPSDADDLPADRQPHGYGNLDFRFDPGGVRSDGVCGITVLLPDYPVKGIRTGQYVPGAAPLWQEEIRWDK